VLRDHLRFTERALRESEALRACELRCHNHVRCARAPV
jgi:hypothetical protein